MKDGRTYGKTKDIGVVCRAIRDGKHVSAILNDGPEYELGIGRDGLVVMRSLDPLMPPLNLGISERLEFVIGDAPTEDCDVHEEKDGSISIGGELLNKLFHIAHENDITLNALVNEALKAGIDRAEMKDNPV